MGAYLNALLEEGTRSELIQELDKQLRENDRLRLEIAATRAVALEEAATLVEDEFFEDELWRGTTCAAAIRALKGAK